MRRRIRVSPSKKVSPRRTKTRLRLVVHSSPMKILRVRIKNRGRGSFAGENENSRCNWKYHLHASTPCVLSRISFRPQVRPIRFDRSSVISRSSLGLILPWAIFTLTSRIPILIFRQTEVREQQFNSLASFQNLRANRKLRKTRSLDAQRW